MAGGSAAFYMELQTIQNLHPPFHNPIPIPLFKTLDCVSFRQPKSSSPTRRRRFRSLAIDESGKNSNDEILPDEEVKDLGVRAALSMLKFYKREISPILPSSCRYVPTCSIYSMEAYKKYGVAKGTILTAWRLCRCNPFGGSGFDPPRWFDEEKPPEEES